MRNMNISTRTAFMLEGETRHYEEIQRDIEENKLHAQAAYRALVAADPIYGEKWYDQFIPEFHMGITAEVDHVIYLIQGRIEEIQNAQAHRDEASFCRHPF